MVERDIEQLHLVPYRKDGDPSHNVFPWQALDGSPLSGTPNLPASFPMVENTTLTKQSTQGPTEVVEGYWTGDLKEAHDEYVKEFDAAGYKVLFEELEDHDSEVSWSGEGRTGQVALRDDCGGDKIYVHITNRPA